LIISVNKRRGISFERSKILIVVKFSSRIT